MWSNLQETEDLVTFIEEILNGKLYFFGSVEEVPNIANIQRYNFKLSFLIRHSDIFRYHYNLYDQMQN